MHHMNMPLLRTNRRMLVFACILMASIPVIHAAEWRALFDGKTTQGWHGYGQPSFPAKGWVIEDGCLKHIKSGGGGDIVTVDQFTDFELEFEWKLGPGANSGVKYLITEQRPSAIGIEYQLLDEKLSAGTPPGKGSTAAAYDLLPPKAGKILTDGKFNHSRIRLQGNQVEHWLNGECVLRFQLDSPEFKNAIAHSKFKDVAGFGQPTRAHILLQDHGGEAWFRDLKIRELAAPAKSGAR
jgi:hypothetical protein